MPLHPVALELLARTGPLAVSGANRAGRPVPTTAGDAQEQLGYPVSVYLDAGPCLDPLPSTIVDVSGDVPRLLRAGAVGLDQLREVVPDLVAPT
jgi:tRNA A37 threonylcarbamoyladenosine synthetase subunit TsaC/SUA5/YrdC